MFPKENDILTVVFHIPIKDMSISNKEITRLTRDRRVWRSLRELIPALHTNIGNAVATAVLKGGYWLSAGENRPNL